MSFRKPITMTFPINTALTNAIQLDDDMLQDGFVTVYAVRTSGAWTSADLGAQGSADGTNYYPITYEDGSYAGGSLGATDLLVFVIPAFPYIKLWSHNSGTSQNQAAAEAVSIFLFRGQRVAERTFNSTGLFSGTLKQVGQVMSADAAVNKDAGIVHITKGTAAVMTLADPVAGTDDFKTLVFFSATAAAHKLNNSSGSGFNGGGATLDVGTFGGAIADGISLYAYNGVWYVIPGSNLNVTIGAT